MENLRAWEGYEEEEEVVYVDLDTYDCELKSSSTKKHVVTPLIKKRRACSSSGGPSSSKSTPKTNFLDTFSDRFLNSLKSSDDDPEFVKVKLAKASEELRQQKLVNDAKELQLQHDRESNALKLKREALELREKEAKIRDREHLLNRLNNKDYHI